MLKTNKCVRYQSPYSTMVKYCGGKGEKRANDKDKRTEEGDEEKENERRRRKKKKNAEARAEV